MAVKKLPKPASLYWAIGNRGGWGEGLSIHDAVKRAIRGSWSGAKRTKLGEGDEFFVYDLDPQLRITHTDDSNGHAIHRSKDAVRNPVTGHFDSDVHPYARSVVDGRYLPPRKFRYQKGAHSDAGANITRI
jgi:hypothetical protein